MAAKATGNCSSLKTLNGLFESTRMTYRRDFLRENKLNLKELQRNTTYKLLQDKQEQERRLQLQLQSHRRQREQFVANRSRSQQINRANDQKKQYSQFPSKRSNSQQREIPKPGNTDEYNHCCHTCNCPALSQQSNGKTIEEGRTVSVASLTSKSESCDKEIQTEDIKDEEFLYEALKKCSSTDLKHSAINEPKYGCNSIHQEQEYNTDRIGQLNCNHCGHCMHKTHYQDQEDIKSQLSYMPHEVKSQHSLINGDTKSHHDYHALHTHGSQQNFEPMEKRSLHNMKEHDNISQCSVCTRYSQMQQHEQLCKTSHACCHRQEQEHVDQVERGMQNLNIDQNMVNEPEVHNSARSRQTIISQTSKQKSIGSVHKIGSRDDIRLPRYLEKEKREKELERQKELARDPKCPYGFYLLPDNERIAALNKAQKKMGALIQELNYMPMTMETLRLRKRKVEIETELTKIESDMRLYSKPKVYLPLPAGQY